jgi:hypothetical protein
MVSKSTPHGYNRLEVDGTFTIIAECKSRRSGHNRSVVAGKFKTHATPLGLVVPTLAIRAIWSSEWSNALQPCRGGRAHPPGVNYESDRKKTMTTIIAQTIAADLVGGVTVILWVICGLFVAVVWILFPFIVCARLDRIINLLSTPQGKETKEQ